MAPHSAERKPMAGLLLMGTDTGCLQQGFGSSPGHGPECKRGEAQAGGLAGWVLKAKQVLITVLHPQVV